MEVFYVDVFATEKLFKLGVEEVVTASIEISTVDVLSIRNTGLAIVKIAALFIINWKTVRLRAIKCRSMASITNCSIDLYPKLRLSNELVRLNLSITVI